MIKEIMNIVNFSASLRDIFIDFKVAHQENNNIIVINKVSILMSFL